MEQLTLDKIQNLKLQAELIRKRTLQIIYAAKAGHTGGSLSAIDVLTALYFEVLNVDPLRPDWPERDRFVMSKGHSVEALYCVLSARGFFPDALLDTYGQFNTQLFGHPTRKVPGIELNSGALGHGLPVAVGMALAARMDKSSSRCYVLMGDGEQGEGSVYEAAMAAGHYRLNKLTALIDRNHLQISGKTEDVMCLEPMVDRWKSFGWEVFETDGNDMAALLDCLALSARVENKPSLIISHSIKGKGVSYMENVAKWHHGVPSAEQFEQALKEIDTRIASLTR
jgi:transketolase